MGKKRETWAVRGCNSHFTETEKTLIAKAFRDGVRSTIIAEQLGCTIRVINDHFGRLSGQSGYSRAPRRRDPRFSETLPLHTATDILPVRDRQWKVL